MDIIQRNIIEINEIVETISGYTADSYISRHLVYLQTAAREGNYAVVYNLLSEIDMWYDKEINIIACVNSRTEYQKHEANRSKIKTFLDTIKYYNLDGQIMSSDQNTAPVIFLSHKSDDHKYGDALRDYIIGLGVSNTQLIYTSHPLNKIPLDEDIYEYLRKHILSTVFMIFLWSERYLDSPACLNEMGAAWIAKTDYTNIFVPDFDFSNPKYKQCAVDTRKMGICLNGDQHCKAGMIELKNKIQALFRLINNEQEANYLLDIFIQKISDK